MLITKVCEQSLRKNTSCNSNQSLNCFLDVFLPVFLIFYRLFVYNAVSGKPHQKVIIFVVFVIHSYVTKSRKPAIISYAHLICQKQKSCGGIQYSLMINQSISNSPHIPTTPKKSLLRPYRFHYEIAHKIGPRLNWKRRSHAVSSFPSRVLLLIKSQKRPFFGWW